MNKLRILLFSVFILFVYYSLSISQTNQIILYLPNEYFSDPANKSTFLDKLSSYLEEQTGAKFKGVSFARAEDMESSLKDEGTTIGIMDAFYVAENYQKFGMTPIATGIRNGKKRINFALFVKKGKYADVNSLQGKSLVFPEICPGDEQFISNVLLEGEIDIASYFGQKIKTKDVSSALTSVIYDKSDVAIVIDYNYGSLDSRYNDLSKLVVTKDVPLPIVVFFKKPSNSNIEGKIKNAFTNISQQDREKAGLSYINMDSWGAVDFQDILQFYAPAKMNRKTIIAKTPMISSPPETKREIEKIKIEKKSFSISAPKLLWIE